VVAMNSSSTVAGHPGCRTCGLGVPAAWLASPCLSHAHAEKNLKYDYKGEIPV